MGGKRPPERHVSTTPADFTRVQQKKDTIRQAMISSQRKAVESVGIGISDVRHELHLAGQQDELPHGFLVSPSVPEEHVVRVVAPGAPALAPAERRPVAVAVEQERARVVDLKPPKRP